MTSKRYTEEFKIEAVKQVTEAVVSACFKERAAFSIDMRAGFLERVN